MPGQVDNETFNHVVADATRSIELPDVEQVARMLPVQCGYQLAGVQLVWSQNRHVQLHAEQFTGSEAQPPPLGGQHCASKYDVDLDLDLAGLVRDEQLGVTQILAGDQACVDAECRNARGDGGQLLIDRLQRSLAWQLKRAVHHVDVHG